jgi:hypothetical protein
MPEQKKEMTKNFKHPVGVLRFEPDASSIFLYSTTAASIHSGTTITIRHKIIINIRFTVNRSV